MVSSRSVWPVWVLKINVVTGATNEKSSVDRAAHDKMRQIDRSFSLHHALSIHLNLITLGGTLWYGWKLASRMKL